MNRNSGFKSMISRSDRNALHQVPRVVHILAVLATCAAAPGCTRTTNGVARTGQAASSEKETVQPVSGQTQALNNAAGALRDAAHRHSRRWGRGWQHDAVPLVELSEAEQGAVEIKTAEVGRRPMRSQLKAMGKVLIPQKKKAIVSYAFSARVSEIHVSLGDWVRAGQELVTLESEEVGNARSEFYKARADHELANRSLERERLLFNRGVGAEKDVLQSEASFKAAEATLNAAEKKLHVLGFTEAQVLEMDKSHQINAVITLHSPLSGKVIDTKAILGGMVDQTTEIFVIMDPTVLWIDAEIYERDVSRIRVGQEVQVSVPAYPAERFEGRVTYVGDVLKEDTRTITMRTQVDNRGQQLKAGMFADVTIYLDQPTEVLALPVEAVLDDRGEKMVFLSVDGGFEPRAVAVGCRENGFYEILDGIEPGEKVVTAGSYQLKSKLLDEELKQAHVH
ncbi:MAG: efflux RND transporter periplasmic adaptor subunit [Acidobacteriota bacterium]